MKLTEERIKTETHWAKRYYENTKKRIADYESDPRKELRLKYRECRTCFYLRGGLAGQAFTNYTCKNCGEINSHSNTAVPKYCDSCSDKHQACKECGGQV